MKKRNRNLSRFLSLLLVMLMAMPQLSLTAFAAELDGETGTEPSVTVTIDVSEASVPDDAASETKTETAEGADGSSTETVTTDNTWSSSETGETDSKTETTGSLPGDVLSEGAGTWTETTVKTDTTVGTEITGQQTETGSTTTEPDGFVSGTSGSIDGHEDTTVTTTVTTTTTTTTVTKGEEATETVEGETVKGDATGGEKTDLETKITEHVVDPDSESTVIDGSSDSTGNTDVNGLEASASAGADGHDEKSPTVGKPDAAEYLKDLAGYDLVDADGNVIGTVQEDGTVLKDGESVELAWDGNESDGWTLNVSAKYAKSHEEILRTPIETYGKEALVESVRDIPEWGGQWDVESDEDGTVTYVHKETGERLDTYEWLYTYIETVTKSQRLGEAALSVTVKPGEKAELDVTMNGATEGESEVTFSGTTHEDMMMLVRKAMQEAYAYRYYGKGNGSQGYQSSHMFWDQDTFSHIGIEVRVNSSLTIRKDPSTASKSVIDNTTNTNGKLYNGDNVTITAVVTDPSGYLWGQIGGSSDKWIRLDFTDFDEAAYMAGTSAPVGIEGDAALTDGAVQSTVLLNFADGKSTNDVWLREITLADGTKTYVYCAERGTPAVTGTEGYGIVNADNLQYIAQNGYWGTEDSLKKLQGLLADDADLSGLAGIVDDGMAMAITQAAIWAKENGVEFMSNPFTQCYLYANKIQANKQDQNKIGALDAEEIQVMKALFDKLVAGTVREDTTTQFITSESIVSTAVKVNYKAEDIDAAVAAAEAASETAKDPDKYNTDLSFTIAVVPSRLHDGGIEVIVYNGAEKVHSQTLESLATDGNGTYTIEGIVLAEGVGVSIELTGAQTLAEGAYLFRSEVSQDQVGVSDGTGSRTVDVKVEMDFTVKTGTTQAETGTVKHDWTELWQESTGYQQTQTRTDRTEETDETRVTVTTTVTEDEKTTVEKETTRVKWHDEWSETYDRPVTPPTPPTPPEEPEIPDEPTPLDPQPPVDPEEPEVEIPEEDPPLSDEPETEEEIPDEEPPLDDVPELEEEDIPDEDIPLSDVPKTGDDANLAVYYVLAAACAIGLCGLAVTGKKRDELQ